MTDSTQQDTLFESTGKTVTLWINTFSDGPRNTDVIDGYGCVFRDEDSDTVETTYGQISYEDRCTSHIVKYRGIINGAEWVCGVCNEHSSIGELQVVSNANIPVGQISGKYDINHSHLRQLKRKAIKYLSEFDSWQIELEKESQSSELQQATELSKNAIRGGL